MNEKNIAESAEVPITEVKLTETRLPVRKKIGFGIADIGGNLFFTAMGFWTLTYLTDTVYLAPALAGIAIMAAKIWDAVTDPIVGFFSDNTRTRFGRRRPYLLFGALPFGLSVWLFFTKPSLTGQTTLFWWALLMLCLVNTAMTLVNIPYSALTPELTSDYNEQTSLNAYRFLCAGIGTIMGAVIVMPIVNMFSSKASGFSAAGGVIGGIIIITTLITFFAVRESAVPQKHGKKKTEAFLSAYRSVFKNSAYTVLLAIFVLHITALNFLQGMVVYYLKYIYQAESFSSTIMGLLLITAIISIPVAAKCSNMLGKNVSYRVGLAVLCVSTIVIFFTGHRIGLTGLALLFVCAGVGVGFAFATPWAMLPDAIAWQPEAVHNEGCYYGVWTFASKLGQAVSTGVSGLILSAAGYRADTLQSSDTIFAIRLIAGPIAAAVCLSGFILIHFYPIDKKRKALA
ncbi:sugar transporter [Treponema sp. OMZ 838]|uniref:MFS transporter n=1 Tax=Treponema sp. OMZ 838 TaxID=1539298 RepID=UPI0005301557|nr:glycoside-pentoside-hexuronide (GPH):cation symporter [Treponema sp. OMZ 838]AIW88398.1 sugar transporter [Treponema sp. OMZ 838]